MLPHQAVTLICVSSIFSFLACVAVGLRLWARRVRGNKIDWSDHFICFTLLNAVLNAITCIIGGVAGGIGLPLDQLAGYMEVRFLKVLFAIQFFIIFSVWGVKVSTLLFYKSVFPTPKFTRTANVTLAVLGAWIITMFLVTLFQDKPIRRNWGTVGTTINWRDFYIVTIATDLALDIFILCMPLPVIRRLHMSTRKKWTLVCIIWLGAVIIVSSCVRLAYEVQVMREFNSEDDDFSFTTINTVIWGAIEPCTSIVAACLPIIAPVIWKKRPAPFKRSKPSGPNSNSSSSQVRGLRKIGMVGRKDRLNSSTEELGQSYLNNSQVLSSESNVQSTQPHIQEPSEIHITRDFRVIEEIEMA